MKDYRSFAEQADRHPPIYAWRHPLLVLRRRRQARRFVRLLRMLAKTER